ncbi:putative glycosyl transferase [Nostoc sp. NIES-4103]|nr:putative glycosyl transferase [Nostoc sp. NIES-4103]
MLNQISVILPVYNGEKTVKETIESVLNQTFKNIELILINDGSTDSTLKIIESIQDARLQVFSYQNAGLATSRNRGLSHCTGTFISFIDADDLWTSDKLESQLKALQAHPKAGVAYSWTNYIDTEGKFLKSGTHITVTGDVYKQLVLRNFLENGSNPLVRSEALKEVGGFDETLPAAEDWDMWLRLAARYEFVAVPKAQILYRVSANSMSTKLKVQEAASLKVIERAFSNEKAEPLSHLKRSSIAYLYKYLTFKALETPKNLKKSWLSAQFLWNYIKYDPSALGQSRLILIAILKIIFPFI